VCWVYPNMLTDVFLLQNISIIVLIFFVSTYNILTLWYLAGIYLVTLGLFLMLDDADIFVGFLWVIDLGVGLVFFIFILHYSTFLHQKAVLNKTARELSYIITSLLFLFSFFLFFTSPIDNSYFKGFNKTWFFLLSWYDYYDFFYSNTITDLNLLREIYFYNNSFEFFLINFMLLYGIITSILICFFIKRVFSFLNINQFLYFNLLDNVNSVFFIRNQNFLKQQSTSTGTRVWIKKKKLRL
jgi:hypothetical protein